MSSENRVSDDQAEIDFARGQHALESKDFNTAEEILKHALAAHPMELRCLIALATAYALQDVFDESKFSDVCQRIQAIKPLDEAEPNLFVLKRIQESLSLRTQGDLQSSFRVLVSCMDEGIGAATVKTLRDGVVYPTQDSAVINPRDMLAGETIQQYCAEASSLASMFQAYSDDAGVSHLLDAAIWLWALAVKLLPPGDRNRAAMLANIGMAKFKRYQSSDAETIIDSAIEHMRHAVKSAPAAHRNLPLYHLHLADYLLVRFNDSVPFGKVEDIKEALSSLSIASTDFAPGDPHLFACQHSRGAALLLNSQYSDAPGDLLLAYQILDKLVRSAPKLEYRLTLVSVLCAKYDAHKDVAEIDCAISILDDTMQTSPSDARHSPAYLHRLTSALIDRFDHRGSIGDLERAISLLNQDILNQNPKKHALLLRSTLGRARLTRYEALGKDEDLEECISILEGCASERWSGREHCTLNLCLALCKRFVRSNQNCDIEDALTKLTEALSHFSGHPDRCLFVSALGTAWLTRFESLGGLDAIKFAIHFLEDGCRTRSPNDAVACPCSISLALARLRLFEYLGDINDLQSSINLLKSFSQIKFRDRPLYSNILGLALVGRFEYFDDNEDIDNAVLLLEKASKDVSDGNIHEPFLKGTWGLALLQRYQRRDAPEDLQKGISLLSAIVPSLITRHDQLPPASNLGLALIRRFEAFGDEKDIVESLRLLNEVTSKAPKSSPNIAMYSGNLGLALFNRFEYGGSSRKDLDNSVQTLEKAAAYGKGRLNADIYFGNLSMALSKRFECFGVVSDVDLSISTITTALDLIRKDHPEMRRYLYTRGLALCRRFERLGIRSDISQSIGDLERAVRLTPKPRPARAEFLTGLAMTYLTCGSDDDLIHARSAMKEALGHIPEGHSHRPRFLSNLGAILVEEFKRDGGVALDIDSLQPAMDLLDEAAKSQGPFQAAYLGNLGYAHLLRFEKAPSSNFAKLAISVLEQSLNMTPREHPDRSKRLIHLARVHEIGSSLPELKHLCDVDQALGSYKEATSVKSTASAQFEAASRWATLARQHDMLDSALKGYSAAIEVLPLLAWRGLESHSQLERLAAIPVGFVADATSCAISMGDLEKAVELLEQGRSIFWSQAAELHAEAAELSFEYPELAEQLRDVGLRLESSTFSDLSLQLPIPVQKVEDPELKLRVHHELSEQWDALVHKVRAIPSFKNFLRRDLFLKLKQAAADGPVVIINLSSHNCDALIITAEDDLMSVCLPKFSVDAATNWALKLRGALSTPYRNRDEFDSGVSRELGGILKNLWSAVGEPVANTLNETSAIKRARLHSDPRVWWVPTGPLTFLPLHAAGSFKRGERGLADLFISSYTPTLSSLLRARQRQSSQVSRLLAVAISKTDREDLKPLRFAHAEITAIRNSLHDRISAVYLEDQDATLEKSLKSMEESSWMHFVCHGLQSHNQPLTSALFLHDGKLNVQRIAENRRRFRNAEFAYLSACQTSAGGSATADEAIHLAAGFQFAGFRSVIGTMWNIRDTDGPLMAEAVYGHLFHSEERPLPEAADTAEALRIATQKLRTMSVPISRWVPFVHIGV